MYEVKGLMLYLKGEEHAYFPGESIAVKLNLDVITDEATMFVYITGEDGHFSNVSFDHAEIRFHDREKILIEFITPEWIADDAFKWEVYVF